MIDVYYTSLTSQLSLKNAWLPHIFFLDTNGTYKDLLSTDSFKPHKNITVFESIPFWLKFQALINLLGNKFLLPD